MTKPKLMSNAEAAARLGMKEREIFSVEPHSHGTVVVTTDGTKTLLCDVPDGEGHTGIMLLERPDGRARDDAQPSYTIPVFAPSEDAEVDEIEHVDEPDTPDVDDAERVTEPAAVEKKSGK
jgi:hypothetical protein